MNRIGIALLACATFAGAEEDLAPALRASLVKLHVTSQSYDQTSPWNKRRPRNVDARGVVIQPGVVLTRASNVRDQLMIEVSVANSARRYPARLKHMDPRLDLALVEVTDEVLRGKLRPLPIGDPVRLDDEFDLYQLGGGNMVERFTARVVRADASGPKLTLQLKTTCSDAGDGQVAVRGGRVVGLLTRTVRSRQEGTLLAVESLRHYLDDFEDGTYHGCPGPGLWFHQLLRDDLRAYYGLTSDDQHGIAVRRVMAGRSGSDVLQPGDVLLSVDGQDLDDEGKFVHPVHGRLNASFLFQGRRYVGHRIKAKLLRAGRLAEVEFELKGQAAADMAIPDRTGEGRPPFLVVGGLVILELNQQNVRSISRSPGGVILRRYHERAGWDPPTDRRRIVFVHRILPDTATKGFEDLSNAPILRVNGKPIHEIGDVAKALEAPEGEFHVFQFEGLEADFVLPVARTAEIDERIAKAYKVTLTRHLE